jgi:hypothetical protein
VIGVDLPQGFGRTDSYLGQELARLDVGPVRACYLVPELNRVRLIEAITAASRRWGGVTEPILPVGPGGITDERWQRIVAALKPDLFVDLGLDDRARAAAAGQLGTSLTSWPDFTGESAGFSWLWCHPLVIDGPLGDAPVPVPAEASLCALAGVGAIENVRGWNVLGPGILRAADELQCVLSQVTRNTVALLSARQVMEEAAGSAFAPPVPALIWVSEPDSFADAIGFWNVRALVATSSPVTAVTAILLPPDVSLRPDLAELLVPRFRARYPRPRPDAFIFSHTVPPGQLRALARQLNLTEVAPPVAQEHAAPGSLGTEPDPGAPLTAATGLDPTPWCCYPRRYGRGTSELVQVFSGRTVIRAPSPVPFRVGTGGWVQVSLSGLRAFAAPDRRTVAQLFAPDAWFSGGRLCLKRATANLYEVAVTIPEPPAVLAAALRDAGVRFTPSDKGKYAQALLDRAPRLEELVRQPGALEVIGDLTAKRTEHFKTDLKALLRDKPGDTSLMDDILALARERLPLPHQSVVELPKHGLAGGDIASILEQLVVLGLCSRGFSVNCAACQMESYVELSQVTRQATCLGCGAAAAYRPAASKPMGPEIRYRLSSLLDRASDQGAPPHILGLASLRQYAAGRQLFILPGVDLHDGSRKLGELDLLGYLDEHLIAGEVKTSPAEFTEEQIRKDLSKAARIGADIYVMVAVHALTAEQEGLAGSLATAQGCQLLTFSGETARSGSPT